jgi:hypothetical protein
MTEEKSMFILSITRLQSILIQWKCTVYPSCFCQKEKVHVWHLEISGSWRLAEHISTPYQISNGQDNNNEKHRKVIWKSASNPSATTTGHTNNRVRARGIIDRPGVLYTS